MNLQDHIPAIQALQPQTASAFTYDTHRWIKLLNQEVVEDFANQLISRENVLEAFRAYQSGQCSYLRPFMLTMIWGFADNGYGTHRTNLYIGSEANLHQIEAAIKSAMNGDIQSAFKALQKIKGLGISYISKVLYFATKASNNPNYALIFDIRVARALVMLSSPLPYTEILEISPSGKYKAYKIYNEMMHRLAEENGISADALEMYLFELKN
jgi:hypothetical protein